MREQKANQMVINHCPTCGETLLWELVTHREEAPYQVLFVGGNLRDAHQVLASSTQAAAQKFVEAFDGDNDYRIAHGGFAQVVVLAPDGEISVYSVQGELTPTYLASQMRKAAEVERVRRDIADDPVERSA